MSSLQLYLTRIELVPGVGHFLWWPRSCFLEELWKHLEALEVKEEKEEENIGKKSQRRRTESFGLIGFLHYTWSYNIPLGSRHRNMRYTLQTQTQPLNNKIKYGWQEKKINYNCKNA